MTYLVLLANWIHLLDRIGNFLTAVFHFSQRNCHQVLQARNRRHSLFYQVELFRLEVVSARLDLFLHDRVVFLADRDHILLVTAKLLPDKINFFRALINLLRRYSSPRVIPRSGLSWGSINWGSPALVGILSTHVAACATHSGAALFFGKSPWQMVALSFGRDLGWLNVSRVTLFLWRVSVRILHLARFQLTWGLRVGRCLSKTVSVRLLHRRGFWVEVWLMVRTEGCLRLAPLNLLLVMLIFVAWYLIEGHDTSCIRLDTTDSIEIGVSSLLLIMGSISEIALETWSVYPMSSCRAILSLLIAKNVPVV